MSRSGWHMARHGDGVVLTRARAGAGGCDGGDTAVRFDVRAETRLPAASPARIAHQVRQDVWRALRRVRGFAPVVAVIPDADGLRVVAGGKVAGAVPPSAAGRVAAVLEHPGNRARWIAHARRGRG